MKTANRSGMTLIELLVAFIIFLMLVGALVSFTTTGLETWTRGEARKDIYDRAAHVLDMITEDLRNTYGECEVFNNGKADLPSPVFACDVDANNRQRLRLVRTGTPRQVRAEPPAGAPTMIPPAYYADFWEVAYVMDHDAGKNVLWRGIRAFDRRPAGSLQQPANYERATQRHFTENFMPVESGVLHVGFKFWTQYTTTWDEGAKLQRRAANSKQASGPDTRWDSSRKDEGFSLHKRSYDRRSPDFVWPEIVQITVELETTARQAQGSRLAEAVDERLSTLRLSETRGMPDPPAMAKIDAEWVRYEGMTLSELTGVKRGQRGTKAASHAAQAPVRSGESFTTEVRIPAYRDAQQR